MTVFRASVDYADGFAAGLADGAHPEHDMTPLLASHSAPWLDGYQDGLSEGAALYDTVRDHIERVASIQAGYLRRLERWCTFRDRWLPLAS
jgi:hypothetical protein